MRDLPGFAMQRFPYAAARWQKDLLCHDGPLIAEHRTPAGEPILHVWCDQDQDHQRWIVSRQTERTLIEFVLRRITLLDAYRRVPDGMFYVIDCDEDTVVRTSIADLASLPDDYVPSPRSYLPRSDADAHDHALLLDGEWESDELTELFSSYRGCYLALYAYGADRPDDYLTHVRNHPWKDGFSAMHFYKTLLARTPPEHRPRLQKIGLSSPGYVRWTVDSAAAAVVRQSVENYQRDREAIHSVAARARRYLTDNRLNEDGVQPTDEQSATIQVFFEDLCAVLPTLNAKLILRTHLKPFVCLKIVLSIQRRLKWLYDMSERNRLQL